MNAQVMNGTVRALTADGIGLLTMDESTPSCNKRFAKLGIPHTEEARCAYRGLIVTTPGLGACISGDILYDETIRHQKKDGTPLINVVTDAGIIPGIKVDKGMQTQVVEAQQALYHLAMCNGAARRGEHHAAMETRS